MCSVVYAILLQNVYTIKIKHIIVIVVAVVTSEALLKDCNSFLGFQFCGDINSRIEALSFD